MKSTARYFYLTLLSSLVIGLTGCANAGLGISVPLGPFGSVGLGVNSLGQITGNVGVGTSVGGVGIGGGTSFPIGSPLVSPNRAAAEPTVKPAQ